MEHLPGGRVVKVAGLVLLRQRPSTAKGITFVTLEDETGQANLIVRQEIWERYRRAARTARALLATGELQKEGRVIHVLVRVEQKLGIKVGESTEDGRIYLKKEEECLAACCGAPMMMVDHKYHENLTTETVDEILDGLA